MSKQIMIKDDIVKRLNKLKNKKSYSETIGELIDYSAGKRFKEDMVECAFLDFEESLIKIDLRFRALKRVLRPLQEISNRILKEEQISEGTIKIREISFILNNCLQQWSREKQQKNIK